MYFLNLKAFHPVAGINTDNHSKYPFLESTDGLFEPDDFQFNFNRSFPFERIELNEDQTFYVSEPNVSAGYVSAWHFRDEFLEILTQDEWQKVMKNK